MVRLAGSMPVTWVEATQALSSRIQRVMVPKVAVAAAAVAGGVMGMVMAARLVLLTFQAEDLTFQAEDLTSQAEDLTFQVEDSALQAEDFARLACTGCRRGSS